MTLYIDLKIEQSKKLDILVIRKPCILPQPSYLVVYQCNIMKPRPNLKQTLIVCHVQTIALTLYERLCELP